MGLRRTVWLTVVGGLLTTDCADKTAFPYSSHAEESREFFLAHKAEFASLVTAAEQDGYTDVSYAVPKGGPWIVYARNEESRGRLTGPDRERYVTLFKRAEIGKVWKADDCYAVGVAHPDPEHDLTATFEAPCEVAHEEPDCRSLAKMPPQGSCKVLLQDGWRLLYFWNPPIDRGSSP